MDLEDVQQRLTRAMGLNAQAMLWAKSPHNERVYQLCRHAAVELQELLQLVTAASEQQARPVEPTEPPRSDDLRNSLEKVAPWQATQSAPPQASAQAMPSVPDDDELPYWDFLQ